LLQDQSVLNKWSKWKSEYELRIDLIVRNKLHIETVKQRDGFLNPNIRTNLKQDIASACMNDILKDFNENKSIDGSLQIILEYCWRIAEVDLKGINSYLKTQKKLLMNSDLISEIKASAPPDRQQLAKDFARDLQRSINEKLATMYGWFKRPQSVAPKASLGLLYKAVVAEVSQTFRSFDPVTDFNECDDVEIMGGAYHVLYDAFYVIVYNAAKHGKKDGVVVRSFKVVSYEGEMAIEISISSENNDNQDEDVVTKKLRSFSTDDIDNAHTYEGRSGIVKLYHLEKYDKSFRIDQVVCEGGKVTVKIAYKLVHG
jgi:hypothetical protein